MAKNKKKVSTTTKTAYGDFEKKLAFAEKSFESSLAFLNNSDVIKEYISCETFEKIFKTIPGLSEKQEKFIEETCIKLRAIFVDCMETAVSDEDYFSLIRELVNLANKIENSNVIKINLDGWNVFYNDKIYAYITSLETFMSVFIKGIKCQKGTGLYPNPKLTYNHKVLKNFILGGIGHIIVSFFKWTLEFVQFSDPEII